MVEALPCEERYRKLEAQHLEETQWFISELERAQLDAIELGYEAGRITSGEKKLAHLRWRLFETQIRQQIVERLQIAPRELLAKEPGLP